MPHRDWRREWKKRGMVPHRLEKREEGEISTPTQRLEKREKKESNCSRLESPGPADLTGG